MTKNIQTRLMIIIGITLAALYFAFPVEKRIPLGLDLKGGMHLILQVDTSKLDEKAKSDAVPRAIEILRNRIDSLGAGETVIQRQGDTGILVQLPGVTDRDTALSIIKRVAQLEFRLVSEDATILQKALADEPTPGYLLKQIKKEDNEPIIVAETVAMTGESISDARVDFDSTGFGQPQISLQLNPEGTKQFAKLTRAHVNERLAIILDGEVLSAPNIKEPILAGNAQISGDFSFEEASVLALALRSGSLPAPMYVEEERTIGPLLGSDSINAGIKATIIGTALVFAFMIIYYMKAGLVSDIALLLNMLLILGTMGFFNVMLPESRMALTLPGIAGIILTLGMAVDANVLINERIREELKIGKPMRNAITNGFNRALSAIIDSNATTLIAAFMLFQFGSGPIKGFAVTLTIGLVASVFTAVFVTRTIFMLMLEWGMLKELRMLSFFPETKINFVGKKRYFCYAVSLILVVASFVTLAKKKDTAYGIDFAGGQIQEYRFAKPVVADEIRQALKNAGVENAVIQQFDKTPETIIIRTSEESYDQVVTALKSSHPTNTFETMRIEKVGPVVGKELRKRAILAIIWALVGILGYVAFRFKHVDFAVAGVIALLHDVVIAFGVLLMFGRQIDLLVITALLTIAGYSINDTIVIYDRVRENWGSVRKKSLGEIINLSVNQTLGRTILTSAVTMLVVISLYGVGGEVLNTFSLCLIIGFISGIYSTVFIASPLVLAWQGFATRKAK